VYIYTQDVFQTLQAYSTKYPHDIRHKDYYLYWLENDILLELNNNKAMLDGIQPNLQKVFPNKSCMQINEHLNKNKTESEIKDSCEKLWQFLPCKGKTSIMCRQVLTNKIT
tara:strand:+ start:3087 stop:3419 length:333 start_codon:yes stop_codon:yes gene_type:complete